MAPQDELKAHATSSVDFYELLGIEPTVADAEIRRAYRKTSLKYHPDKVGSSAENLEKFHLLQIANDVLSDPAVRTLYDQSREARERRKRENALLEGRRRQMKDDLERRESGVFASGTKRSWDTSFQEETTEQKLEREVRRIAEENRKRRMQMNEDMRRKEREALEAEERKDREMPRAATPEDQSHRSGFGRGGSNVPDIQRTIKIRWARGGLGDEIGKDSLMQFFSTFGTIENSFLLKDKKQRIGPNKEKKMMGTGIVVYTSIVGAHAAVSDWSRQAGQFWAIVDSVIWAEDKEPERPAQLPKSPATPTDAESPSSTPVPSVTAKSQFLSGLKNTNPITPTKQVSHGLKKAPSFASFSPAAFNTPKLSSTAKQSVNLNSPSFEELTMMKLKNAQREQERRRLEEQIKLEEEAVDRNGES